MSILNDSRYICDDIREIVNGNNTQDRFKRRKRIIGDLRLGLCVSFVGNLVVFVEFVWLMNLDLCFIVISYVLLAFQFNFQCLCVFRDFHGGGEVISRP